MLLRDQNTVRKKGTNERFYLLDQSDLRKQFPKAVVRLQIALEEICAEAAKLGQVLICHRGSVHPAIREARSA